MVSSTVLHWIEWARLIAPRHSDGPARQSTTARVLFQTAMAEKSRARDVASEDLVAVIRPRFGINSEGTSGPHCSMARWNGISPAERSKILRKVVSARWAKVQTGSKGRGGESR